MTPQQFEELKSLIQLNAQGISRNYERIGRNYEMIGRIYEEHGGRLTRVEVLQEQFNDDLRAVAEGVTGNAERLDRLAGRFDRFEVNFERFSASITGGFTDHEQRLRALED